MRHRTMAVALLLVAAGAAASVAAERLRFWNLTAFTITELRLAPAGTTAWGADQVQLPSKITIFRGPLVRANRTPDRLAAAVAETVYHEIAHHLGISDARLHQLAERRIERS